MKTKKAIAIWKVKAGKDRGEDFLRPRTQRQHSGEKYNATGTVGRAPQRPNRGTGQSVEVR